MTKGELDDGEMSWRSANSLV